jgi:hypothetical protein
LRWRRGFGRGLIRGLRQQGGAQVEACCERSDAHPGANGHVVDSMAETDVGRSRPGRELSRVLRWCPRSMGAGNKRLGNECVVDRHHDGLPRPDDAQRRPHRRRRKYDRASGAAAVDARCRRAVAVRSGWSFRAAGVANDVEGIDDCIGGRARDEETRNQRGENDRQRRCQRNDTTWRKMLKVRAQGFTPCGL